MIANNVHGVVPRGGTDWVCVFRKLIVVGEKKSIPLVHGMSESLVGIPSS